MSTLIHTISSSQCIFSSHFNVHTDPAPSIAIVSPCSLKLMGFEFLPKQSSCGRLYVPESRCQVVLIARKRFSSSLCRLVVVPVNEDHMRIGQDEDVQQFTCEELAASEEEYNDEKETSSFKTRLLSFAWRLVRHYVKTFVRIDTDLGFDVSVSLCMNEITTSTLHADIAFGLAFCTFLDNMFNANESSTQRAGRCYKIWKLCNFNKKNSDFMTFVGISKLASNCAIRMLSYEDRTGTRRFDLKAVPVRRDAALIISKQHEMKCDEKVLEHISRSYVRACKILRDSSHVFNETKYEDLNTLQLDQLERHATCNSDRMDLKCARIVAREHDRIRRCVLALQETQDLVSLGPLMLESSRDMLETCRIVMNTTCSKESEDYVVLGSSSSSSSSSRREEDKKHLDINTLQNHVHGIRMSYFDGILLCLRRGEKSDVMDLIRRISPSSSLLVTRLGTSGLKSWEDKKHDDKSVLSMTSKYARIAVLSVAVACWIGGIAYVLQLPPRRRISSRAQLYRKT